MKFPNPAFDTAHLQSLNAQRHLELLDIIDSLRAEGLNEHVDLPQLIVCGDQSSGKSSLLEAISGVPFPKKDNLCTRFATEVNLRRNNDLPESQITVSLMASTSRSLEERLQLEGFKRELPSMAELPTVMDEAAKVMGIGETTGAFSADVLRLEVRGPGLPQLTIVDLPGLVHSENRHQSGEDILLVSRLVDEYMQQERSIILAVVSAKNDYANQIVLKKAREVDPDGKRTLGVITKPDTLHPRSPSEASFIALAKNQDVNFSLGWHVIRNLDSNQPEAMDRDAQEDEFFMATTWKTLDKQERGIRTLRDRLSAVLFQQIRRELPSLIAEIATALEQTSVELSRMGPRRATHLDRQMFLVELGQKFQTLCLSACDGQYENSFFDTSEPIEDDDIRRLRAALQNRSIEFSQKMLSAKPCYSFRSNASITKDARTPLLTRAKEMIKSHRGKELPGTFNPLLIGQLFRELSERWLEQTREHVDQVWLDARSSVISILAKIADDHVRESCMHAVIDPQLEKMRSALNEKLVDYMQEYRRQPITYNDYLIDTVQKAMAERRNAELTERLTSIFGTHETASAEDIRYLVAQLTKSTRVDMDDMAAESLTDFSEAYYKLALKRLNDEVPAHVIEPIVMSPLPNLLQSTKILQMPRETIDLIGGESDMKMKHRETLQAKLNMFKRSSLICKVYSERDGDEPHALSLHKDFSITKPPAALLHAGSASPSLPSEHVREPAEGPPAAEPETFHADVPASVDEPVVAESSEPVAATQDEDEPFWARSAKPSKKDQNRKKKFAQYTED